jgi:hypothetical protein
VEKGNKLHRRIWEEVLFDLSLYPPRTEEQDMDDDGDEPDHPGVNDDERKPETGEGETGEAQHIITDPEGSAPCTSDRTDNDEPPLTLAELRRRGL